MRDLCEAHATAALKTHDATDPLLQCAGGCARRVGVSRIFFLRAFSVHLVCVRDLRQPNMQGLAPTGLLCTPYAPMHLLCTTGLMMAAATPATNLQPPTSNHHKYLPAESLSIASFGGSIVPYMKAQYTVV